MFGHSTNTNAAGAFLFVCCVYVRGTKTNTAGEVYLIVVCTAAARIRIRPRWHYLIVVCTAVIVAVCVLLCPRILLYSLLYIVVSSDPGTATGSSSLSQGD